MNIRDYIAGALLATVAATVVLAGGCKGGGPGPDPDRTITVHIGAKDQKSKKSLDSLTVAIDGEVVAENEKTVEITRKEGVSVTVTINRTGYMEKQFTLRFTAENEGSKTVFLTPEDPDNATIQYQIQDEDGTVVNGAQLFVADTLAGAADGSITLPFGDEPVELCGRAEYHNETCQEVTPNRNYNNLVITLSAQMVDVTFNSVTDTETGEVINEATIMVDDYTYEATEETHSFPASDGSRAVQVYAAGTDTLAKQIAADKSHSLDVELTYLPACMNGLDDDGDGFKDANDDGCVDTDATFNSHTPGNGDFTYEPQDDNEVLMVSNTGGSNSRNEETYVSSESGHREEGLYMKTYPETIQYAIHIEYRSEYFLEANEDGEDLAFKMQCGPESEPVEKHEPSVLTDIVLDSTSFTGKRMALFSGFNRSVLQEGVNCGFSAVHGSKARGENPGNGNDAVTLYKPGHSSSTSTKWYFEPEEVPGYQQ